MNYEEKYKEALERAKKYKLKEDLIITQDIFPELKESEDEKIRKALIKMIEEDSGVYEQNVTPHEMIAWLEKQGNKTIVTPQWMIDFLDELRRHFGTPMDYDERKEVDGKLLCIKEWLEKQGDPQDKGEISDGYHTFNELYYYRMLYNAAFFNMLPKEWVHKSKRHNDGEECFGGGWFIVMANLPTGQISNHYELKDWDLFQIPEKEVADKWDGHTPQEAADRLHKYLLEKQSKQSHWKPTEEQLQTIHTQLNEGAVTYPDDKRVLTTLYEDLMKITTQEEKKNWQKPADNVEPKFKVGDLIKEKRDKYGDSIIKIEGIDSENYYYFDKEFPIKISEQDNWELVEQKTADKVEPKFKIGDWVVHIIVLLNA